MLVSLCLVLFVKGVFGENDPRLNSVWTFDEDSANSGVCKAQEGFVEYLERYYSSEQVFSEKSSVIDSDVVQDLKCGQTQSTINHLMGEESSSNENVVMCPTSAKESTDAVSGKEEQTDTDIEHFIKPEEPEDKANISDSDTSFLWNCLLFSIEFFPDLDAWLTALLDTLPATFRRVFTNDPLSLTPARSLLFFCALCSIASIIFSQIFYQTINIYLHHYKKYRNFDQGFNTERALTVVEQENEDLKNEVETLKSCLHDHEVRSHTSSDETIALATERNALRKQLGELNDSFNEKQSLLKLNEESHLKLSQENESLNVNILKVTQRSEDFEAELDQTKATLSRSQACAIELQSKLDLVTEELSIIQASKEQILAESESCYQKIHVMSEEISQLRSEKKVCEESIILKDCELTELKGCYSQLKVFEEELINTQNANAAGECEVDVLLQNKMKDMLDVAKANAKLKAVEDECCFLKTSLSVEMETRFKLEENLKEAKEEVTRLMASHREAEHQVNAAKIKMDVLSTYFKDKEKELNRKLGEQEAREKANADVLVNTDVKTKEFEAMVQLYKEKIDNLQQEIQKIEADYRRQIAVQEKKAHDCWLSARKSEREVKEQKIVSENLRQKTVELQTSLDTLSEELKIANELRSGPNPQSGLSLPPVELTNHQPVPQWRGFPPLLVRPRPFFPIPAKFNTGDRAPFPSPFHEMRPPPVQTTRYPTDDWRSPRGRDMSPPLIHSSPIHIKDQNQPVPSEVGAVPMTSTNWSSN